jgi:hypothetical protein
MDGRSHSREEKGDYGKSENGPPNPGLHAE